MEEGNTSKRRMAGNIVAENASGEQWVGLTRPTDPSRVNATRQSTRHAPEDRKNKQQRERARSMKVGQSEVKVEGTEGRESRMEGINSDRAEAGAQVVVGSGRVVCVEDGTVHGVYCIR